MAPRMVKPILAAMPGGVFRRCSSMYVVTAPSTAPVRRATVTLPRIASSASPGCEGGQHLSQAWPKRTSDSRSRGVSCCITFVGTPLLPPGTVLGRATSGHGCPPDGGCPPSDDADDDEEDGPDDCCGKLLNDISLSLGRSRVRGHGTEQREDSLALKGRASLCLAYSTLSGGVRIGWWCAKTRRSRKHARRVKEGTIRIILVQQRHGGIAE